jgi:alkylation response protein AidB-like acyl-CoA dehydrogenase
MTLILTEDEESLRDSVRRFVADRSPLTKLRDLIDSGQAYDEEVWKQLSAQLGLAGLIVDESHGGAGAGVSALSAALYELGAGLVASPLLATTLAAAALSALGDPAAADELLPGLASGELVGTVAWVPGEGALPTAVASESGGSALTGQVSPVLNGAQAHFLLVAAQGPDGLALYQVAGDAAGLTREPLTAVDHSKALATVRLGGTPAVQLTGNAAAALAHVADVANLALAAEQCGAMAACITMTSEYAKIRVAFGQPIGAFQAVKHKLADLQTAYELAFAALRAAARSGDETPGQFSAAASVARVMVSEPYFETAADTIQLHGGIGFTWEHDAHLYYKNALSSKVLFGGPAEQLDRLAATLGV